MAITRPQLHDAIVQTKEYIDKNVSELQDKIYSRGGYVIVDSLPVQNVQMDKTYLVPKVDSNGYAISGSYLEYVYAIRYNSGTTITDGLIDLLYDKFIKMLPNSGTYAFVYDGELWKYNDETVVLYDYGITILDGTPVQDDTITVSVSNGSWEPLGDATLDLSGYYNKTDIDAKETALNTAISGKENQFRYTTMPTANNSNFKKIVQYIGETTNDYIKGYSYICLCTTKVINKSVVVPLGNTSNYWNYAVTINIEVDQTVTTTTGIAKYKKNGVIHDNSAAYAALSIPVVTGDVLVFATYSGTSYSRTVYYKAVEPEYYYWDQYNVQPQPQSISSINDIEDVEIINAQDGQAIVYDEENDKWINKTVQSSSNIIDDTIATANKTWSSHKISEAIGAIQNTINNNNDSIEITLIAANWDSNGEQTITFDSLPDDINGVIGVPISATLTQKEEFSNCNITVIAQNTNELTFKANEIPTINLPVMIYTGSENIVNARYNYSTEEQVIGTWIDGKPLYQKTLLFTNVTVGSSQSNIGDISELNIDFGMVVSYVGNDNNGYYLNFGQFACWLRVPDNNIGIQKTLNTNASILSELFVTIQYTKMAQQQEPVEEPEEQSGE